MRATCLFLKTSFYITVILKLYANLRCFPTNSNTLILFQHAILHMEKTASTPVIHSVSIRHVTDLTEPVSVHALMILVKAAMYVSGISTCPEFKIFFK